MDTSWSALCNLWICGSISCLSDWGIRVLSYWYLYRSLGLILTHGWFAPSEGPKLSQQSVMNLYFVPLLSPQYILNWNFSINQYHMLVIWEIFTLSYFLWIRSCISPQTLHWFKDVKYGLQRVVVLLGCNQTIVLTVMWWMLSIHTICI